VAAIEIFDGKGSFTLRDYIGDNLRTMGQTNFSTGETGTYTGMTGVLRDFDIGAGASLDLGRMCDPVIS